MHVVLQSTLENIKGVYEIAIVLIQFIKKKNVYCQFPKGCFPLLRLNLLPQFSSSFFFCLPFRAK